MGKWDYIWLNMAIIISWSKVVKNNSIHDQISVANTGIYDSNGLNVWEVKWLTSDKVWEVKWLTSGNVWEVKWLTSGNVWEVKWLTSGNVWEVKWLTSGNVWEVKWLTSGNVWEVKWLTSGNFENKSCKSSCILSVTYRSETI